MPGVERGSAKADRRATATSGATVPDAPRYRCVKRGGGSREYTDGAVETYFAQQPGASAAPSEGRSRSSAKYTGQNPVKPL